MSITGDRREANAMLRRANRHARTGNPRATERLLRQAIPLLQKGSDSRARIRALAGLGVLLEAQGRYRAAAAVLRRAIRDAERVLGARSVGVARLLNDLGVCYKYLARFPDAGQAYQRALGILERRLGRNHFDVATLYHNLGGLEHAAGNWARGEPFARESLRIRRRVAGPGHPAVAADMAALAALLDQQRKNAEAESLYRGAIGIYERVHGPEDPVLATSLNNLAAICDRTGRRRQAEELYRRTLAIESANGRADHPKVAFCKNNLAVLLVKRRRLAEAETLCREALATFEAHLGLNHPNTGACLENLSAILAERKRRREAASCARRARRIAARVDAVNDEGVAVTATVNPLRASFRLMVQRSRVHRFGVFADEAIPRGRRVIEYVGERIGRREAVRRWDPKRSYLFGLSSYWRIDGAIGGSGAEFINHSCEPNVMVRLIRGRLFYFSKRRIGAGEELTLDYKYDPRIPPIPCHCGAKTCRGTLNRLKEERRPRS
jgi:tetratricopeptide (TPR) repeat protein